jgi:hypothetical protein
MGGGFIRDDVERMIHLHIHTVCDKTRTSATNEDISENERRIANSDPGVDHWRNDDLDMAHACPARH